MDPDILARKKALRREVRGVLAGMAPSARQAGSEQARERLAHHKLWCDARSVLFFAPLKEEVDIWPLLRLALGQGKSVALPRFVPETNRYTACHVRNAEADVQTGWFGIREPGSHCQRVEAMQLDLILVPGLAFDLRGRRLGRGKGYYDRLLGAARGVTCGVAFDEQIVAAVPMSSHDMTVHCILTPTRWIQP